MPFNSSKSLILLPLNYCIKKLKNRFGFCLIVAAISGLIFSKLLINYDNSSGFSESAFAIGVKSSFSISFTFSFNVFVDDVLDGVGKGVETIEGVDIGVEMCVGKGVGVVWLAVS